MLPDRILLHREIQRENSTLRNQSVYSDKTVATLDVGMRIFRVKVNPSWTGNEANDTYDVY